MNIPLFDQNRKRETTSYGEAVRLSNELRSRQASTIINMDGIRVDIPTKTGFDIETCDVKDITDWLNTNVKKSESLLMFVFRVFQIRFPTEFAQYKTTLNSILRNETELIESNNKNEVEWFGQTGYQNMVRLDGSLTNNKVNPIKQRNGSIKMVRI